jgi:hypothetical protein
MAIPDLADDRAHAGAQRQIIIDRTELADARWFDRGSADARAAHPDSFTAPVPVAIAITSSAPGWRRATMSSAEASHRGDPCTGIAVLDEVFRVDEFAAR